MSSSLRIASVLLPVLFLFGCASQAPAPVTPAAKKPAKQAKHYFRAPTDLSAGIGHYPRFPSGARSVDDVLNSFEPYAMEQLEPYFTKAGVEYPPSEVVLLAIKDEKRMEIWARDTGRFKLIREYKIKAASGMRGPKLQQGDRQVPEGIYHISRLNPNSNYHLSMKVDYPNQFDLEHAEMDGRSNLGGDIFIHGKNVSAGCLAMGDGAIEELFVMVAHVGTDNIRVIITPSDPRNAPLDSSAPSLPVWTDDLYREITTEVFQVTGAKPPTRIASSRTDHPLYKRAN
jgi:hypothetical protein